MDTLAIPHVIGLESYGHLILTNFKIFHWEIDSMISERFATKDFISIYDELVYFFSSVVHKNLVWQSS